MRLFRFAEISRAMPGRVGVEAAAIALGLAAWLSISGCQDVIGVAPVVADDCGDGLVAAHEQCDGDGQGTGGETESCDADCTLRECGDGTVNRASGEQCDTAGNSASCDDDCTVPACGDGLVNPSFEPVAGSPEECDDGNDDDSDDCRNICVRSVCGDGIVHNSGSGSEHCDGAAAPDCPGLCSAECRCRLPVSCQDQLMADGGSPDGNYLILPARVSSPVSVFCDMTTDGGGWTAIDPGTAVTMGGSVSAVVDTGQTTCRIDAKGLLQASDIGGSVLVCQYDIDLGFAFNEIRTSQAAGEVLTFDAVVVGSHTTDVRDHIANPWGTNYTPGGWGDVVIGTPANPTPVLSLGRATGAASYGLGQQMRWLADEQVLTANDTVLRVQASETGGQSEGYRWISGRIYVRLAAQ